MFRYFFFVLCRYLVSKINVSLCIEGESRLMCSSSHSHIFQSILTGLVHAFFIALDRFCISLHTPCSHFFSTWDEVFTILATSHFVKSSGLAPLLFRESSMRRMRGSTARSTIKVHTRQGAQSATLQSLRLSSINFP